MEISALDHWSFVKRFKPITYDDFRLIGGKFCHLVKQYHRRTSETTVTLYKEIPSSIITNKNGVSIFTIEENAKNVLAVFTSIEDVPKDLFNLAENVQVAVRPNELDSSNVCGYMECKGLLPRHMVFNVSPYNIGKYIRSLCLGKEYRPSKFWFGQGDGFKKLHHYFLS